MVWPPPPEQPRIEYLYSFSQPADLKISPKESKRVLEFLFGKGKDEPDLLLRPQGVACANGTVLVTDLLQGCVHVFNQTKKEYFKIKRAGDFELASPVAAAAAANGGIYVSDSKLGRVFAFDAGGKFRREIGKGQLRRPTGIAVDRASARLYIVDTLAGAVNVFDGAGDFLFNFGAADGMNHPTYIAADGQGSVFVVDSLNFRVLAYSREGKLKNRFGKIGRGPGSFSLPKGIAADSEGNVYVSDASFDNIQIFNQNGKLLLFFGESGGKAGQFWVPAGIGIDENDRIYVADAYNRRVQVFRYLK
jgi:DNA-binding beta-propeller fold protein YncE